MVVDCEFPGIDESVWRRGLLGAAHNSSVVLRLRTPSIVSVPGQLSGSMSKMFSGISPQGLGCLVTESLTLFLKSEIVACVKHDQ